MLVDGKYYESMTVESALEVLHGLDKEKAPAQKEGQT